MEAPVASLLLLVELASVSGRVSGRASGRVSGRDSGRVSVPKLNVGIGWCGFVC